MGKDELERGLKAKKFFLLLHDQVVSPFGILSVASIIFGGIRPAPFFVDGKVAVVDFFGSTRQIHFREQTLIRRQFGGTPVFLFKDSGVVTLHGVTVGVVLTVFVHRIDEKQRQHFDTLRAQAFFLVQVFLDGAADHFPLHGQRVHIAVRLAHG